MIGRIAARVAGVAAVAVLGAGCSSSGGGHVAPAADTGTPTVTSSPSTSGPGLSGQAELTARQLSDPGLPSRLGAKPTAAQARQLVQYLEDRVNAAYSDGDAGALTHYLAGPMLSGNRATILLLAKEHRRNVVAVHVSALKIQTAQPESLIVDMRGRLTKDYFVDTRSRRVLANGLPGAKPLHFLLFLNRNPTTHTWYWTGEQAVTNSNSTGGMTSGGTG